MPLLEEMRISCCRLKSCQCLWLCFLGNGKSCCYVGGVVWGENQRMERKSKRDRNILVLTLQPSSNTSDSLWSSPHPLAPILSSAVPFLIYAPSPSTYSNLTGLSQPLLPLSSSSGKPQCQPDFAIPSFKPSIAISHPRIWAELCRFLRAASAPLPASKAHRLLAASLYSQPPDASHFSAAPAHLHLL